MNKIALTTITQLKLVMDNGVGANYASSTYHTDFGKIVVETQKKVGSIVKTSTSSVPVKLAMSTNTSGVTTILSCADLSAQFQGTVVTTLGTCVSPNTCNYPITSAPDYLYVQFASACSSKCNSGDGDITFKIKNTLNATLYAATACHAQGVGNGQTNTIINYVLLPKIANAAAVEVSVSACNASSTNTTQLLK